MTAERLLGTVLPYFFTLVLFVPAASPQASTATVSGTVRDQSGAVVPGAAVTLTNSATGVTSKTTTNPVGFYIFPGAVPGPYGLAVEAPGMQRFEGKLTVQVQQSAVVDPVLTVGQATTAVSVKDVTPLLTTDAPTLSHVLERERIEQLPINGRFISALLQTVPGLEEETEKDSVASRGFGMRRGSTEYVLDGAATTDRLMGGVFRRPPGLDTIQEFKVETNVSSAKLARPTTIIMSTKGGTNEIHGSAFETARNNAVGKARTRTDFYDKPPQLIRNEFGVSAGGPVYLPKLYDGRNRTFWFFSYEGGRKMAGITAGFSLPTEAMRRGDFRGVVNSQGQQYKVYDPWTSDPVTWSRQQISYQGVLNVIDPARESPFHKALVAMTPLPTLPDVNPLVADNFYGPQPDRRRDWTVSTRIDHRFSENDMFYARFSQGHYDLLEQFVTFASLNTTGGTVRRTAPNKSFAASWVHTVSPTLFNEVLVSASKETWYTSTGDPETKWADILGLPNPNNAPGWPSIQALGSMGDWWFAPENTQGTPFGFYIFDDNATKIVGRHELQFGLHFRYDDLDTLPEQQFTQGSTIGSNLYTALYDPRSSRTDPLATSLTGDNGSATYLGLASYWVQLGRPTFQMRGKEYALYFQDNFKVNSRLTLNLGLRYDYWPPYREVNGLLTAFDREKRAIVLGAPIETMIQMGGTVPAVVNRELELGAKFISYQEAGWPKELYTTPKANFGPRAGFAYRLSTGNRPMVLRGGYRISHFTVPLRAWTAGFRSNAPMAGRFGSHSNSAALSPDGIANYWMRNAPAYVAGVNSRNALTLDDASSLQPGGVNTTYFARHQPTQRVHDWNLTLEREVTANTVLRASYVGNHSDNLEQYYNYNPPTPSYIWYATTGLPLPGGAFANVATRPFDQTVYGTISEYRMSGWGNFNGISLEAERRYSNGYAFQLFYTMGNALAAGGQQWAGAAVPELNQFMPGAVPADFDERNRLINYSRDAGVPKHRVRWNWLMDLPFGKGKPLGRNAKGFLDKVIGGWQLAGMGSLRSNYFSLPTNLYPTGAPVEIYGYQYPIEDCRSGACRPGYLWWNGYIPANQINSVDANGRPNGIMGVPANYKPSAEPLIPWPAAPDRNDPMYSFFGTNTVWVPMQNGSLQRINYDDGLNPWRNQFKPSIRQWGLDASLFKAIPIKERMSIRFNADFFNVLNHPGNPNSIANTGILSTVSSGQPARELQLTLRLTW